MAIDPNQVSGLLDSLPAVFQEDREGRAPNFLGRFLLGFEQVLLGELVKEMAPSLTDGPRGDAMQDAMTQALTDAGGIGVAAQLYTTLKRTAQ